MPSKTITLEATAYEHLRAAKRPGESFSDVVNRLTRPDRPTMLDLVGLLDARTGQQVADAVEAERIAQGRIDAERDDRLWKE